MECVQCWTGGGASQCQLRNRGTQRVPLQESLGDFPLKQSLDETLSHAFDQVSVNDGQQIQPNVALSHPFFSPIIKHRLYRVVQDTQSKGETRQLLVPKSHRELLFLAALHCQLGTWARIKH